MTLPTSALSTTRTAIALLGLLLGTAGCFDSPLLQENPGTCVDDSECTNALCIVGVCVDPSAENIASVDIEIRPPEESGLLPQQLFGLEPGAGARQQLKLRATATLVGSVVDAAGVPLAAKIFALPEEAIVGRSLVRSVDTSSTTGTFELRVVENERYRVSVSPVDTTIANYVLPQVVTATSQSSTLALGEIKMPDPATLLEVTGVVVAGEGIGALGIPALEVRLLDGQRRVSSIGVTDRDGAFSVHLSEGQASGVSLTLQVRPTEENSLFPVVTQTGLRIDQSIALPTIELGSAVTSPVPVGGLVIGPDSRAVPSATVYASATLGPGTLDLVTSSDADGRYTFDLPPGEWTFSARAPSSEPRAGLLLSQRETITSSSDQIDLVVGPRVVASGRVVPADPTLNAEGATLRLTRIGAPGGGEEVQEADWGWAFLTTATIDGEWTASVDPGRYRVSVTPVVGNGLPEYTRLIDIFTNPPPLNIELPPPAHLAGQLQDPSGVPLGAYGEVRAFTPFVVEGGESIQLGSGESDDDGNFGIVLPDFRWRGAYESPDDPETPAPDSPPGEPESPPESDGGP